MIYSIVNAESKSLIQEIPEILEGFWYDNNNDFQALRVHC